MSKNGAFSTRTPKSIRLPFADWTKTYAPLVAPLTLAITGTLFLSGWTYQSYLLMPFGLEATMFPVSIQSTLSIGFVPLVLGAPVVILFTWIAWTMAKRWLIPALSYRSASEFLNIYRQVIRGYYYYSLALYILAIGALCGGAFGAFRADQARRQVASGCARCHAYAIAHKEPLVGVMIVQNDARMALLTEGGLMVVSSSELNSVSSAPFPRHPRQP
jgi:hypothetical protein